MVQAGRQAHTTRVHTKQSLGTFNLLECPVWAFDVENKNMWFANESALEFWGADSQESFLRHSHCNMDEASRKQLWEHIAIIKEGGQRIHDQWTLYPQGRRVTTHSVISGFQIQDDASEGSRLAILVEVAEVVEEEDSARDVIGVAKVKQEVDPSKSSEQSEFLAVMAHELRTPLHQVIGFVELLTETKMTDQQQLYVRPLQSSSMSLMTVINDLLDYTKIAAGKLQLEIIPMDVQDVLKGCREVMEPKACQQGLSLQCQIPEDVPNTILGDPNRLRQVILNLMQNSVKFTHAGAVTLSVTTMLPQEANGRVRLRFQVEDTGIGISQSDQGNIFKKYQQANATITRRYGGTGLGLAICKSIVEAMGGSIKLDSELDRGTRISFEVPFDVPTNQMETVKMETSLVSATQKKLHLLVVEDNKLNQKVIKAMLQRMGHSVSLAENGALGVEAVEKERFDAVLMDVQMPVMDGIEATRLIRSKGYCVHSLPVVGLTASYQPSDWQFYRDCGMNDCIGKPARMNTLRMLLSDMKKLREGKGPCTCAETRSEEGERRQHPQSLHLATNSTKVLCEHGHSHANPMRVKFELRM